MLVLLVVIGVIGSGLAVPTGHISDNANARKLFAKVDTDNDMILSRNDFEQIFKRFDLDGNHKIDSKEFVSHWGMEKLGSTPQATYLFYNLDVNKDGVISQKPDLTIIFDWFDSDNSGQISEGEFIILWHKLTAWQ